MGGGSIGEWEGMTDRDGERAPLNRVKDPTIPPRTLFGSAEEMRHARPGHAERPRRVEPLQIKGRNLSARTAEQDEGAAHP